MLTDKGAIRVNSPYDKKMYVRINLKNIISSSVCLLIGVGGLIASIVFGAISGEWDGFIIGGCAIITALSVFLLTVVLVSIKKGVGLNKRAQADMFLEYMHVSEYSGDEKVSEERVYYNSLLKSVETKEYFLAYINKIIAHPIFKADLTKEEINTVRKLLNLEQNDDGEVPVGSGKGAVMLSDDENLREIIISPNKKTYESAGDSEEQ
ncbi:MAG: YcxB family protein [Clostridiales bacterium]|nr:YcxB family protein [Clostridiales bacterium]